MIEYLIMSAVFNLILIGFMFYKLIIIPQKYKRVILIEEKNGKVNKVKLDYAKVKGKNTLNLLYGKKQINYGTRIGKDGKLTIDEKPYEFVDNKGKDVIFLRTDGELITYCGYNSGKIHGLTMDQRKTIYDFLKTKEAQYDPENRLDKFINMYGVHIIWGVVYLITVFFFLKYGGEPSSTFSQAVNRMVDAINSFSNSLGGFNAPSI